MVADRARRVRGDGAVVGAAWFRRYDWPWHLVDSADLARCVCGARDPLRSLFDPLATISFGLGGYLAGRVRSSTDAKAMVVEETERADGVHGLGVWALAVVMGAILATLIGVATVSRTSPVRSAAQASAAEPLLSYELDRFRAGRRAANVDLSAERAEAGRILLTTSSHSGVSSDDRVYLIQQVGALTGLSPTDAERRVDNAITSAKMAIARSRRSSIIVAFSVATALLLGAVAAWAAACAGGRHRDGAPMPVWMARSNVIGRR
jgi:hypothetical protein